MPETLRPFGLKASRVPPDPTGRSPTPKLLYSTGIAGRLLSASRPEKRKNHPVNPVNPVRKKHWTGFTGSSGFLFLVSLAGRKRDRETACGGQGLTSSPGAYKPLADSQAPLFHCDRRPASFRFSSGEAEKPSCQSCQSCQKKYWTWTG